MKNKIFYFLLVLVSLVLPVIFMKTTLTGVAFLFTLMAVFGAGRAFHNIIFPSKHFEFNSFGLGFILLSGFAFLTAFFSLPAICFKIIYLASVLYAVYWLIKYFKENDAVSINTTAVIIYLLILAFNVYPTLLIQGYAHDNSFSWVNTDATVYTSIANRVKLGIYPITIPGFGIGKLYYHFGVYAFGGFVASIFNITASDSLFGIIRCLAIFSITTSIVSIAQTSVERSRTAYRIAGALIGFFFIGSLTSVFEYLPVHFPRIDHGMKHLRGFLIGHSSLWIYMAFIPVIAFINYKIVHNKRFNFLNILLFTILVCFTGSLNFVAGTICFCMMAFFMLFYKNEQVDNSYIKKRNFIIISLPVILLLAGITLYLYRSAKDISSSLFFLPVFDLGTWSYFLFIFFVLYIGLRVFGLNYLFSKAEIHFGYIQFMILGAAISFMLLLGFFVDAHGGRENDIKYGYVIIQGTFGLFSGLWLGDKFGKLWNNKSKSFSFDLRNLFYPFITLFAVLFVIAFDGYANSKLAHGLVASYLRPVIMSLGLIAVLMLVLRYKKMITANKTICLLILGVLLIFSVPGVLHEFNKYRDLKTDDEAIQLNAADLKLIKDINAINEKNKLVLLSVTDNRSASFPSTYKFSSMINAPVLNEGSTYFGVSNKTDFLFIKNRLDSFYVNKNLNSLKNLADRFGIGYFAFNSNIVDQSVFNNSNEFKQQVDKTDSMYIIEYIPGK